jgi:hypothetical protein
MNTQQNTDRDSVESTALLGLSCGLTEIIDWQTVLAAPRYAGGHEEVMRSIFGAGSEVIAWWSENNYQGTIAIAHKLTDGRVVVMTDYYGSCSGCDCWEGATDEDAKKQVLDLVNNARVFGSLENAQAWCADINATEKPHEYPFEAARNLWPNS